MRIVAFGGRLLLSAIFLLSGIAKLTDDDVDRDGSTIKVVTTKMNCFLESVERVAPMPLPLNVVQEHTNDLVFMAGVMEVAGACLFILDFSLGAMLLMLFLIGVTPVMHNFWDPACYREDQLTEIVNFFKNMAILGGLIAYLTKVRKNRKPKTE